MHARQDQVDTAVPGGYRHHNVTQLLVDHGLDAWDLVVGHVQPKLEEDVVEVLEVIHLFQPVIILRRDIVERVVIGFQGVGTAFTAGDHFHFRYGAEEC
ncbi:hypothetical protein D3C75_1082430 [compost metagenome]